MKLKNSILLSSLLVALATTGCISNNAGGSNQTNKSSPRVKETRQQYDAEIQAGEVIASTDIDSNTSLGLMPDGRLKECSFAGEDAGCRTIATLKIQYDKEHPGVNHDYISSLDESGEFNIITATTPSSVDIDTGEPYSLMGINSIQNAFRCNYKDYKQGNPICVTTPEESDDYSGRSVVMAPVFNYEDSKKVNPYIAELIQKAAKQQFPKGILRNSVYFTDTPPSIEVLEKVAGAIDLMMYFTLVYDIAYVVNTKTFIAQITKELKNHNKFIAAGTTRYETKIASLINPKTGRYSWKEKILQDIPKKTEKDAEIALSNVRDRLDNIYTSLSEKNLSWSERTEKLSIDIRDLNQTLNNIYNSKVLSLEEMNSLDDVILKYKNELSPSIKEIQKLAEASNSVNIQILRSLETNFNYSTWQSFRSHIMTFGLSNYTRVGTEAIIAGGLTVANAIHFGTPNCKNECNWTYFGTESREWYETELGDRHELSGGIWKIAVQDVYIPDALAEKSHYKFWSSYYQSTTLTCNELNSLYPEAVYAAQLDTDHWNFIVDRNSQVCNLDRIQDLSKMVHFQLVGR